MPQDRLPAMEMWGAKVQNVEAQNKEYEADVDTDNDSEHSFPEND